jgi:hypothetical protein
VCGGIADILTKKICANINTALMKQKYTIFVNDKKKKNLAVTNSGKNFACQSGGKLHFPPPSLGSSTCEFASKNFPHHQCDQIGLNFALWATLGYFLLHKFYLNQQICCYFKVSNVV